MNHLPVSLVVWGEYACFTRPEAKVERVSYPIMTPSAARGVLEAIFWKEGVFYIVKQICVLAVEQESEKNLKWISLKRNELKKTLAKNSSPIYINDGDVRDQRQTLALKGVRYRIEADICCRPDAKHQIEGYREQFNRRADKGQYFHHPYLGCREFVADFEKPKNHESPVNWSENLGKMFLDRDYEPKSEKKGYFTGKGKAVFFDAVISKGVLKIEPTEYKPFAWAKSYFEEN